MVEGALIPRLSLCTRCPQVRRQEERLASLEHSLMELTEQNEATREYIAVLQVCAHARPPCDHHVL